MNKPWFWLVIVLCPLSVCGEPATRSAPKSTERHRSPADVAVLPDGKRALTANQGSDSVSLIDLDAGKVLAEESCGRQPVAVACSADGRRAAVSNLYSSSLTLLEVGGAALRPVGTLTVGPLPRGLVFAPDGDSFYLALAGANEVLQIAWSDRKVLRRWPAPVHPRRLALSRDGGTLLALCERSNQVHCWDTRTGKPRWQRTVADAFNLHGLALHPDGKEVVTTHCHDRHHPITHNNIEQGWAMNNRLTRLTVEPDPRTEYWQVGLDVRGLAVGDPGAAAYSAAGEWLAVAAGGTHELLLLKTAAISWSSGDPGDFVDVSLELGKDAFRRVALGGRPAAVQFVPERAEAVVANYLLDAVQVVNARSAKLVRTIRLGGPSEPSLARQGEAIFYDAQRSHHQWFSCHSCHPDGHTCCRTFDTLNDNSLGNPKQTPTLRGVAKTGPWTWHGWQDELGKSVEKSLTETLFGRRPTAQDVHAVVAYLETLDHPPSPHRMPDGSLSAAAARGKALFFGKAHCARCHKGEQFTSAKNYDVKLEEDGSPYELWNPPSLHGLWDRGPYLHDGRVDTLEELLRAPHAPEKLGGKPLTSEERRDLVEFLKAL